MFVFDVEEIIGVLVIAHCFNQCFFQMVVNFDTEDVLAIYHEIAHGAFYLFEIKWAVFWGFVFGEGVRDDFCADLGCCDTLYFLEILQ